MLTQIKFGTSGWRAVMAEEFTFANVQRAVRGIAHYVASQKPKGVRVIVGRDPRFLSETIMRDKIAIGGEESGGLSIRHHVPEKDGVLAGLLGCEVVANRGKTLGEQLQAVSNQVGSFYPQPENFRLTAEVKTKFTEKLKSDAREFCGRPVRQVVRTDGLKVVFSDGSWSAAASPAPKPWCASARKDERPRSRETEHVRQELDF